MPKVLRLNEDYAVSIEEEGLVEIFAYHEDSGRIVEDIYAGSVLLDQQAVWILMGALMNTKERRSVQQPN